MVILKSPLVEKGLNANGTHIQCVPLKGLTFVNTKIRQAYPQRCLALGLPDTLDLAHTIPMYIIKIFSVKRGSDFIGCSSALDKKK
jgi:hypothetical protein